MKSDHLNSAIQAVNNIISNLLNKKIYKQQLTELQKVRRQKMMIEWETQQ